MFFGRIRRIISGTVFCVKAERRPGTIGLINFGEEGGQVSPVRENRTPGLTRRGLETGSGGNGACNDVAIVFRPTGAPWLIASYLSEGRAPMKDLDSAHTEIGRIVAARAKN